MGGDRSSHLGRLTRELVEALGSDIVNGRYQPGEVLPTEAQLTSELGVSRSILREAIKILNGKGLVTARPRRGTSILHASSWNLFDTDVPNWILKGRFSLPLLIEFAQVRIAIEPQAAALAAEHGNPAQKKAICSGFERMVSASEGKDDDLASDIEFHLAILDASNNRFLACMKPMVRTALSFSIRYTDRIKRDEASKIEVHRRLCDAIGKGDPEEATLAARNLLEETLELMQRRKR